MRYTPIVRLATGQPRYGIVSFHQKGQPTEHCVVDRSDGAWMMPRVTDIREAVSICSILSNPGDVPLVTVNRHDVAQLRLEV